MCDVVQIEKCNGFCDVVQRNDDGVLIRRYAEVMTPEFEKFLNVLLTEFQPCVDCGEPVRIGDVDRCDGCIMAQLGATPCALGKCEDCDALTRAKCFEYGEPTSQFADSREAAGMAV